MIKEPKFGELEPQMTTPHEPHFGLQHEVNPSVDVGSEGLGDVSGLDDSGDMIEGIVEFFSGLLG